MERIARGVIRPFWNILHGLNIRPIEGRIDTALAIYRTGALLPTPIPIVNLRLEDIASEILVLPDWEYLCVA